MPCPIATVIIKESSAVSFAGSRSEIATVIVKESEKAIATVVDVRRGPRGTTDINAIAPVELSVNDEISLQNYIFTQTTNLATWTINHNLNRLYPPVTIKDNLGETIIGEVLAIDANNLQITFTQAVTGIAYLG